MASERNIALGLSCGVRLYLTVSRALGGWLDFLSSKAARLFFSLETIAQFDQLPTPIRIADGDSPSILLMVISDFVMAPLFCQSVAKHPIAPSGIAPMANQRTPQWNGVRSPRFVPERADARKTQADVGWLSDSALVD